MRWPKWPRWVWRCYAATFAAVAAFVVCSFVPMWAVMNIDPWCGFGRGHTLWGMLESEVPGNYSESNDFVGDYTRTIVWRWEKPAVITAVAVHVAAIVGFILGGIRWRKGEKPHPPSPAPVGGGGVPSGDVGVERRRGDAPGAGPP